MNCKILQGDALRVLKTLPDASVHCCVTSPPYWRLRDYRTEGQLGLEKTPEEYVAKMVEVFREVKRVLRDDGTLWLNLGDSYYNFRGYSDYAVKQTIAKNDAHVMNSPCGKRNSRLDNLKGKDLVGVPWMVAFALRADGWYLRSDIIWNKPNPMPESVTDRCTKSHEYVFLLTKSAKYYYDAEAIKENEAETTPARKLRGVSDNHKNINGAPGQTPHSMNQSRENMRHKNLQEDGQQPNTIHLRRAEGLLDKTYSKRNKRSVWTITTQPYRDAHFATFPEELPKTCIMAGTSERGCCPKCGSPWERVVETERKATRPGTNSKFGTQDTDVRCNGSETSGLLKRVIATNTTTGWQPTCDCDGHFEYVPFTDDFPDRQYRKFFADKDVSKPVPCTVLDPFAGSGTVGAVAESLGRNSILIELNPAYIDLIKTRTAQQGMAL